MMGLGEIKIEQAKAYFSLSFPLLRDPEAALLLRLGNIELSIVVEVFFFLNPIFLHQIVLL